MDIMNFSMEEVIKCSIDAYRGVSTDDRYTAEERQEGLRNYLRELGKDFEGNKGKIFSVINETANEILPNKVREIMNTFADFKSVDDGQTIRYRVKNGKIKAHIMAIGGVAERQRVDHGWVTITSTNVQAKIYDEYDRFASGQVDWTEMMNEVINAIMESILKMVQISFEGLYKRLPAANLHTSTSLDEKEFKKIISVVKAYGQPVIIGTPLALANIPFNTKEASEADKMDIRNKGYLGMYNGCPVVELPNSFEDKDNTIPVLDDKNIYVLPSGQEKVIKVCLEGGMHTRTTDGADWTTNFEAYQKVGVTILGVNNLGVYRLSDE